MKRTLTYIFGAAFLIVGLVSLIPALSPSNEHGQLLLHVFQSNTEQNVIHFASALAAFAAAAAGTYYASMYLRAFGVVYALVALWGLPGLTGAFDGVLFGLVHVNPATELLHIAIAAVALYGGFVVKDNDDASGKAV